MDPYLERHRRDVHGKLAVYTSDELNELLPADLAATTEERVAIESREDRDLLVGPDVSVEVTSRTASDDPTGSVTQKMLNFVYSRGRYAARVRYDRPLRKPLDPDDAAWADELTQSVDNR